MKRALAIAVVTGGLFLALMSACGSWSSATCCLNGKAWTCKSNDGAANCGASGDTSDCTADPSRDAPAGSTECKPT